MSSTRRQTILDANELRGLAIFSLVLLVIVPTCAFLAGAFERFADASWRPGLDPAAFMAAPLATRVHAIAILSLTGAAAFMFALPKGDRRHRTFGWLWVAAMAAMGTTSLLVPHGPSWMAAYLGGGSALALLVYGVFAARRGNLVHHGRTMSMLMIALTVMTLLALIPGRLMHNVVFGG